MQMTNKGKRKR